MHLLFAELRSQRTGWRIERWEALRLLQSTWLSGSIASAREKIATAAR
jgi:hypothetical protein